jgi:hypothetical protein
VGVGSLAAGGHCGGSSYWCRRASASRKSCEYEAGDSDGRWREERQEGSRGTNIDVMRDRGGFHGIEFTPYDAEAELLACAHNVV